MFMRNEIRLLVDKSCKFHVYFRYFKRCALYVIERSN